MEETKDIRFKVLPTGDPQSLFYRGDLEPERILKILGRPTRLISRSAKTDRSEALGWKTGVMYLTSGLLCSRSSAECRRLCLAVSSGRMAFPTHAQSRDRKAALFFSDRTHFEHLLRRDLDEHVWAAKRESLRPAVRLNGASDAPFESIFPKLFEDYPGVIFYDYTKIPSRVLAFLDPNKPFPKNYSLTFSLHSENQQEAERVLEAGGNVAVVFSGPDLPEEFRGREVIDGDADDCRFLDPLGDGYWIGLRAKGAARTDCDNHFVIPSPGKESLSILAN